MSCKLVDVGGMSVTICYASDIDHDYDGEIDEFTKKFATEADRMVPEQKIQETSGEGYTRGGAPQGQGTGDTEKNGSLGEYMTLTYADREVIYARRAKWIEDLRFGGRIQQRGSLASGDYTSFCCLGVACEVLGSEFNVTRTGDDGGYFLNISAEHKKQERTVLFDELRWALGLSEENQSILISLNDGGADFKVIAMAIGAMSIHEDEEY